MLSNRGECELCTCCKFQIYDTDIRYKCRCGHGDVWHKRLSAESKYNSISLNTKNKFKKIIKPILQLFNRKKTLSLTTECPICLDNIDTLVVLNCGHPFCYDCSKNINITCPICRTYITNKIKVYN